MKYKVLSLFDGISCGLESLKRAGKEVESYHASEINKYAIKIAMKNHPEIIQLGDIKQVSGGKYDLLIGGSPCQGFSFLGKNLNFDDKRSKLFFEYARILKECKEMNPNIKFLLENVRMKEKSKNIISEILGIEPVEINSSLVSAQERKRLYWTNINNGIIPQPENKNISIYSIIEPGYIPVIKSHGRIIPEKNKSHCLGHDYYKGPDEHGQRTFLIKDINNNRDKIKDRNDIQRGVSGYEQIGILRNDVKKLSPIECERLQTLPDNYTESVSDTQRYMAIGNGWTIDVITHIFNFL